MQAQEINQQLLEGAYNGDICHIYSCTEEQIRPYIQRIANTVNEFEAFYGKGRKLYVFSAPGRTEICGNHTDHQRGKVLTASVTLDIIGVVALSQQPMIRLKSAGFPEDVVYLNKNIQCKPATSTALIQGVVAKFSELGYSIRGFDVYTVSNVFTGSGLSSSAAFEVLVGTIINHLFCNVQESPLTIAQIGQFAENYFFGKPSGLMDQAASSIGGLIKIDFKNEKEPRVDSVALDLEQHGYALCIIDTHSSHAKLTNDYAEIPQDMKAVARYFGKDVLSEVDPQLFYSCISSLRSQGNDRAILRAIHFFAENDRVDNIFEALQSRQINRFLDLIIDSGRSSFCYLQNIYSRSSPLRQSVSLALAMCEHLLSSKHGAWRVHGGGFAGTVQAFVPVDILPDFIVKMNDVFGLNSCYHLKIRPLGGTKLIG